MTGKEYLGRVQMIDTQLKNKNFEKKQLEELGLSLTEINESMRKLQSEKEEIIKTIEQLPENLYDVLHKVYIQYETLYEVASDRKMSYSNATTLHGKALSRLEKIINCE